MADFERKGEISSPSTKKTANDDGFIDDPELAPRSEVEPFLEEKKVPIDKWNIVYFIIMLHGIGALMPWNMFITIAPDYYTNFKMADRVCDEIQGNCSYVETNLSNNFMSYMTLCSQIPNLLLNFANIFITVKGDLTKRISLSLIIVGSMVAFTMSFIYVDTWSWTTLFFVLTMISIVLLNGANGVYQNSIFGVAADFPFKYTNAVIIGNNLCGTFVTVVSIVTGKIAGERTDAAFSYFSIALLTLLACFSSFFLLRRLEFYNYNVEKSAEERARTEANSGKTSIKDYIETFKQGKIQFLNVFLVFFVTLTCFPGMMVNITSYSDVANKDDAFLGFIKAHDFRNFFCFLLFNVFAFIGSMLAGKIQFPSAKYLIIPVSCRILFIPFFAFCNYLVGKRGLPIFFTSPFVYIVAAIIMSLTNGYFSGLAMMYAPSVVEPSKQRIAGMIAAFFLILGIVLGLTFTMVVSLIVAGPM